MYSVVSSVTITPTLSVSFFFNDTATTEIYTLSLHDALPIYVPGGRSSAFFCAVVHDCQARIDSVHQCGAAALKPADRKSTRLNSSHVSISYAVFCLKKKKQPHPPERPGSAPAARRPTCVPKP